MFKMIKIVFGINLLKVELFCIDSGGSIVLFFGICYNKVP